MRYRSTTTRPLRAPDPWPWLAVGLLFLIAGCGGESVERAEGADDARGGADAGEAGSPPEIAGTAWSVRAFADDGAADPVQPLAGSSLSLRFGEDGTLGGSSGCNQYTAGYSTAGDTIRIGPVAVTRKLCAVAGVMEQESAYLVARGRVERFAAKGGTLELRDGTGSLAVELQAVVTGTVAYRQRIALPPTARVEVRLEDVSLADAPAATIAETRFVADGAQVPLPFTIAYDPAEIDRRHTYSLRATILDSAGEVLFRTTSAAPAITRGAPVAGIELLLEPARE